MGIEEQFDEVFLKLKEKNLESVENLEQILLELHQLADKCLKDKNYAELMKQKQNFEALRDFYSGLSQLMKYHIMMEKRPYKPENFEHIMQITRRLTKFYDSQG